MGQYKEILEIVSLSLFVSMTSALIASALGIILAVPVVLKEFSFKKYLIKITATLMGIPPVLMGLLTYLTLSRKGPLGSLKLLYTPAAMMIAQVLLIFPIVFGLTVSMLGSQSKLIKNNCLALGAGNKDILVLILKESKPMILSVFTAGFGRAVSEVGAVMMVGGNIKGQTRVMTTYISLETGKGNFHEAIVLGAILLIVSFIINYILYDASSNSYI